MEAILHKKSVVTSAASEDVLFDYRSDQFPTLVSAWKSSTLCLEDCGSHFGFVQSGRATMTTEVGEFELSKGMYFCVPGTAKLDGEGIGFTATRIGYSGFLHIGGPVEAIGRLRYIDGCTDSLLISPVVKGDPCLNLLHIPPNTRQTAHTHPSLRAGIIISGEGVCQTPQAVLPLTPGLLFVIPAGGLHSFHTHSESLRVIAWHPESDFGPTDHQHPMVNRTLIDGRPVNAAGDRV